MKKRARRRADLQRMKVRALRLFPLDVHATVAEHLKFCSCLLCGNSRRYVGRTLQEVKADLRQSDEF